VSKLGLRSRPVADASGAPVLRDQGPIGRPGTARPMIALDHPNVVRAILDHALPRAKWGSRPGRDADPDPPALGPPGRLAGAQL
jgi:hypothetical protein